MYDVRQLAWEFMGSVGIDKLPVKAADLFAICDKQGWKTYAYQDAEEFFDGYKTQTGIDLKRYSETKDAFTMGNVDGAPIIFYDIHLGNMRKIRALTHEIGHIVCRHTGNGILGKNDDADKDKRQEQEAEVFSIEFCAPLPVMQLCKVVSPQEVMRLGIVDEEGARAQYLNMIDLGDNCCTGPAAEKLQAQFSDYARGVVHARKATESHVSAKSSGNHKRTRIIAIAAICVVLAAVACYMFATLPGRQHVYITRDGDKYHNRDCQYVEGKDLAELTVQEAIEAGYEPCSVCF